MHIDWSLLGLVFVVSFGAGVAVIVLFSLGITALARNTQGPSASAVERSPAVRYTAATLCFAASALIIAYGIYVLIAT